jgi:hypothetical protein
MVGLAAAALPRLAISWPNTIFACSASAWWMLSFACGLGR